MYDGTEKVMDDAMEAQRRRLFTTEGAMEASMEVTPKVLIEGTTKALGGQRQRQRRR